MTFDPEQEYGWFEYPAVHMRRAGSASDPWPAFPAHGVLSVSGKAPSLEGAYDAVLRAVTDKRWDGNFDRFRDYVLETQYPRRHVRLTLDATGLDLDDIMTLNSDLQSLSIHLRSLGPDAVALQFVLEMDASLGL